ncbi:MAG: four helix bundle protein, partial [Gammaproteobacteria bacterium]
MGGGLGWGWVKKSKPGKRVAYTFYFEKLEVWQLARKLVGYVYELSRNFPGEEKYGLTSQMRRAAVSVASNIAEGCSRKSSRDQAHFTQLAYSSLMELLSHLLLAVELKFTDSREEAKFRPMVEELANKLNALRNTQLDRASEPEVHYGTESPPLPPTLAPLESSNPQSDGLRAASPNPQSESRREASSNPQYQGYWVHESAIIDPGAAIGKGTKIWHFCHVMPGAVIGQNCSLGQ